jgi:hypothetical protein
VALAVFGQVQRALKGGTPYRGGCPH